MPCISKTSMFRQYGPVWGAVAFASSGLQSASCQEVSQAFWMPLTEEQQVAIKAAAASCAEKVHHASGPEFYNCTRHEIPSTIPHSNAFLDTLRNFSCSVNDTGTPPRLRRNITLESGYAACPAYSPRRRMGSQLEEIRQRVLDLVASADAEALLAAEQVLRAHRRSDSDVPSTSSSHREDFSYLRGVLPGGNDLLAPKPWMTAAEAMDHCTSVPQCNGFTFTASTPLGPAQVWFKSTIRGLNGRPQNEDPRQPWHTYRRNAPSTCAAQPRMSTIELGEAQNFSIEVVREKPVVAVVRNFASAQECNAIASRVGDVRNMQRSVGRHGGVIPERRSYSMAIFPNLFDPADIVTRVVSRSFAITRNITGFELYPPGQEPLNAVLYKDPGDEYLPHCDGGCRNDGRARYQRGERVATTIIYCRTPELGGATTFTMNALKIAPKNGDMLLFSHRIGGNQMAGKYGEHSGCPIRKGYKFIATQWYREGVNADWTSDQAVNFIRSLDRSMEAGPR